MGDYIVYALFCPRRRRPVYVGQSSRGIERPFEHIKEESHSQKVNEWVAGLREQGLNPIVVILEYSDKQDLLMDKETFWIQKYIMEGNILLNQQKVTPIYLDISELSSSEGTYIQDIGLFIKTRRKLVKLTQAELAEKAGTGVRFIRDLEQGTKDNFNTSSIDKVLKLFGSQLSVSKRISQK
jgi:hypothetical protein